MDNEIRKLNLFSASSLVRNKNILTALIVMVTLALAGVGFMYYQYQKTASELKKVKTQIAVQSSTPKEPKEDEIKKIVAEIAKVARLPENEIPSVATITDVSKLKDQPFFKDAKNGDILLVFNTSGKAVLYDPKEKKIVDVTTLSTSPSFNQQFKIVIRNGTSTPNLVGKLEADLKKALGVVNVTAKENALKQTYEKTQVSLINPSASEFVSNVSKVINAQVVDFPSDEPKPKDADILIIIGKDRI